MDPGDQIDKDAHAGECFVAAFLFACIIAVQLWLVRAGSLLYADFWTDEIFTFHLVTDPSLGHFLQAMRAGVDTQTPGYHLLLRLFTLFDRGGAEPAFRLFSLGCTWWAMVGMYALLRRSFRPLVAAAGSLALWSHPLVLNHAFDARYYAPWLALTVWFAFLVKPPEGDAPRPGRCLTLGLASILLCTIHYFGILTWGLIVSAQFLFGDRPGLLRRPSLAALLAGPAVLLVCMVTLLPAQTAAMQGTHWVAMPTLNGMVGVAITLLLPGFAAGVLLVALGAASFRAASFRGAREEGEAFRPQPLAGLIACVLLIPGLAVMSYLLKPVLTPKYAICATLIIPCAVAYALRHLKPLWVLAACCFLIAIGARQAMDMAHHRRARDQRTDRLIASIRIAEGDGPVTFQRSRDLYPVAHYAPDLKERCRLYGDETSEDPIVLFSDVHARIIGSCYDTPGVILAGEARALPGFFYVRDARAPHEPFPGRDVRSITPRLVHVTPGG